MEVSATVTVSGIEDNSRTLWSVEDRKKNFVADFEVDLRASISTLLSHYGLDGQISVSVAP